MEKGPPLPSDAPPPLPPLPPGNPPPPPPSSASSSTPAASKGGPTAFKFKSSKGVGFKMGSRPKASPMGLFAKEAGRESPEPEETAQPQSTRPAMPRAGLPPPTAIGGLVIPDFGMPGLASGLAAAQAAAAKFNEQLAAQGLVAKAADEAVEDTEAVEATEWAAGEGATNEMTRGGYTFCRKYGGSRWLPIDECDGLQSIDRYENLGIVGRGAFNKIYKAKHRESGEIVALKAMQLSTLEQAGQVEGGEGVPLEMMREMSILMSMRHPNIVGVKEVVVDSSQEISHRPHPAQHTTPPCPPQPNPNLPHHTPP